MMKKCKSARGFKNIQFQMRLQGSVWLAAKVFFRKEKKRKGLLKKMILPAII